MMGPRYNEADVKQATLKPRLKKGIYKFRVLNAGVKDEATDSYTGKVNEKGNYVIGLRCAPVDGNGDTKSPSANMSLVGPFITAPEDLAAAGLPADAQKAGKPKTLFLIERYADARKNEKSPVEIPQVQELKRIGGKWTVVDAKGVPTGEALEPKEARQAKLEERAKAVMDFYIAAYANAALLQGDEFYGEVDYDPTGKFDGPQIEVLKNQDPATLDLVDMTKPIEEIPEVPGASASA